MTRWQTDRIAARLRHVPGVMRVVIGDQGGDVDSDNIMLYVDGGCQCVWQRNFTGGDQDICNGHHLWLTGFVIDGKLITTPNDCDVEMVELCDGNSEGGLTNYSIEFGITYVRVRALLHNMGFEVVRCMKDYF